jgi:hypothetical protein
MVKMMSQEVTNCVIAELFNHISRIDSAHRERVVLLFLGDILIRYCAATQLSPSTVLLEINEYGRVKQDEPPLDMQHGKQDYERFMSRHAELLAALDDEGLRASLFLTLSRVSFLHCTIREITLGTLYAQLEAMLTGPKEVSDARVARAN